jgi:hypothetical protein
MFWPLVDDGGTVLTPDTGTQVTVTVYSGALKSVVAGVALGSPALITTSPPHALCVGQQVLIAGVTGTSEINGTWTVTSVPTPTTFTIAVSAANPFTGGGTVAPVLYVAQRAALNESDKVWEWTLPPQSQLDSLEATWSAIVDGVTFTETYEVDIVYSRLANPWLMRLQDPDIARIAAAPMGKQALLILIDEIEEGIRDILGYPPVLEGYRLCWDTLRGTLNDALYVSGTVNGLPYGWGAGKMLVPGIKFPQQIYSGSINGVPMDPINDIPMLLIQNGALIWADYRPWISGRYTLWGTHGGGTDGGPDPDGDLKRAARRLCHHFAQHVDFPDRAYSIVTEGASILFSMPAPDRPTGLPEVDAVLARKRLTSVI